MGRTYNVIDADGHVLEPVDIWEKYMDPAYRDRAPKIIVDKDGKERLNVEGKILGSPKGLFRIAANLKWRNPQACLQVAHLLGDARLRNSEPVCRAAKAFGFGHGEKVTQVTNVQRILHRDRILCGAMRKCNEVA